MPSRAFTDHLLPLLRDAEDLDDATVDLRDAGWRPRPGPGALSRAVVVACVSAWEAYVEELVRESLTAIKPVAPPLGPWAALNAAARAAIGRFNTPNTDQVRLLIADAIGLPDVHHSWAWSGCPPARARERLQQAMDLRHAVAHGVNPRPAVNAVYASLLPEFFRQPRPLDRRGSAGVPRRHARRRRPVAGLTGGANPGSAAGVRWVKFWLMRRQG